MFSELLRIWLEVLSLSLFIWYTMAGLTRHSEDCYFQETEKGCEGYHVHSSFLFGPDSSDSYGTIRTRAKRILLGLWMLTLVWYLLSIGVVSGSIPCNGMEHAIVSCVLALGFVFMYKAITCGKGWKPRCLPVYNSYGDWYGTDTFYTPKVSISNSISVAVITLLIFIMVSGLIAVKYCRYYHRVKMIEDSNPILQEVIKKTKDKKIGWELKTLSWKEIGGKEYYNCKVAAAVDSLKLILLDNNYENSGSYFRTIGNLQLLVRQGVFGEKETVITNYSLRELKSIIIDPMVEESKKGRLQKKQNQEKKEALRAAAKTKSIEEEKKKCQEIEEKEKRKRSEEIMGQTR